MQIDLLAPCEFEQQVKRSFEPVDINVEDGGLGSQIHFDIVEIAQRFARSARRSNL